MLTPRPKMDEIRAGETEMSSPTVTSGSLTSEITTRGRLAIDGKATTRRTALSIPRGMPIDAWRNIGRQIFIIADSSGWWLGDWLIYGQANFPDRYRRAIAETSLDYQTLRNYAWVARQFTAARRRERLSFQHHAEVASLDADQQDLWLTRAEQFTWSRNELRRQIRASKGIGQNVEPVVNIQVSVIPHRQQLWQQAAEVAEQDLMGWILNILDNAAALQMQARPQLSAPAESSASAIQTAWVASRVIRERCT